MVKRNYKNVNRLFRDDFSWLRTWPLASSSQTPKKTLGVFENHIRSLIRKSIINWEKLKGEWVVCFFRLIRYHFMWALLSIYMIVWWKFSRLPFRGSFLPWFYWLKCTLVFSHIVVLTMFMARTISHTLD